ncbi:MAG: LytTR family transcriptional regulator DNA-binding domain-containing protein [Gammaproteobacteria bacterium]|nr:LytTR family transcriptional regulator DNA-binding domain-containing protein [Gammaproteobacteria bacterium]
MIKALIVEDSELARFELVHQLKAHGQIQLLGEAEDLASAREMIHALQPELVFLDIDLPGGNAFALLKTLEHMPRIIFTTAYDHYALEAFDYPTVDYLLKPIQPERLAKALAKLEPRSESQEPSGASAEPLSLDKPLFVKDGERTFLVRLREVRVIEAIGNYSRLHGAAHSPLLYRSLNKLEERLDGDVFFRASRQHIVNLHYIDGVETGLNGGLLLKMRDGAHIEVSRRQSQEFRERFSL